MTDSTALADTVDVLPTIVDLTALFHPRAIAILGASGRADNPFARPLEYLREYGFAGPVYPVNPGYSTLGGVECFAGLDQLPGPVDLVLMMVSAQESVRQLPAVANAGATAAIVFASGFAEVGPDGAKLQAELVRTAQEHGIRLLGPNCQGMVNAHDAVVASFTAALESGLPEAGAIAYVGQSGAVGGSIFSLARERGLRIGAWASTGNQADLDAITIATYLLEDERLQVFTLYLESPVEGTAFDFFTRRAAELNKSVLILQSALSGAGARAAASHTGAMIGDNAAFIALCDERGVIRANDVEEFIATAHALSVLPRSNGRRLAIVTTSGGAGSLAADQAEVAGLTVEDLDLATQSRLATVIPAFGAVANPVDVTAQLFRSGSTDEFREVCELVLADDTIDSVLIALTMVTGDLADSMALALNEVWRTARKPVVVVWMAARQQTVQAREILRTNGWPIYDSPRVAIEVLSALATPAPSTRPEVAAPAAEIHRLIATLNGSVTESQAAQLLSAIGVPQPELRLVDSAAAAHAAAQDLGSPLVVKIQSPEVLHKTERGGVELDVDEGSAASVYERMVGRFAAEGATQVMFQQQAGPGLELLVGVTNGEPGFPPLLTIAIGGVLTELYADTTARLTPVDPAGVEQMIRSLRAAAILTGYRGSRPYDLEPVSIIISRLSAFAAVHRDRLVELEVNPLRLCGFGAWPLALDFLLQLAPGDCEPGETELGESLPDHSTFLS